MAIKKGESKIAVKMLGILTANAGGFMATAAMNQADQRIDMFKKNPMLSPLAVDAVAGLVLFMAPDYAAPLAYGMMGASGSDLAGELVQGLSRVTIDTESAQDELEAMEAEGYGDSREVQGEHEAEKTSLYDEDEEEGDGT